MSKVLRPLFYSGQNVYRDNLQNIVEYDADQRKAIITKLYHDGVISATPYDLSALRVVTDSYRNNVKFTDFQSSLTANNPITLEYTVTNPPNARVMYAQKFQARSNNIQKVRLWALLNVPPGVVWGTIFVEIRPLVGHTCTSTNSCNCQSVIADDLSDLYTEPSSEVLARVVIDHNLLNDSFPYLDVNFSTEPRVSNIDGRSDIVSGKYYAIVIGREYSAIDSVLSIHGNYGNNISGLTSYVTRFDPDSGLWIDQTGDSMAFQVFSNTIEILPGDGYVNGDWIENPFVIEDSSGTLVDYHLGNIDLVHMQSVTAAGAVDAGGQGRNMVIARIVATEADYQPNPRTGNPAAIAEAEVIEVMVITEKEWRQKSATRGGTTTTINQSEWLILAYVTDENIKTVKGLYEPPCDINSSVIHGNWSPGLISIEDARKFLPHAQVMKYGAYDEIPARSASTQYNTELSIEEVQADQALAPLYDKDPIHGPYNVFRTACNARSEMSVFDSSFGVLLTTPHLGKYLQYVDDSGNWKKINVVPPMLQSVVASADPTSLPRALSASTTIGGCINANMGLRVRLNWTPPDTGCHLECADDGTYVQVQDKPYRGVVIVRSTEDFPRAIDDGTIIAASEAGFVTSDGRTYSFNPVGQVNSCCASSTAPGIIGTTTALVYPMPEMALEVLNITPGGEFNADINANEYAVTPGNAFYVSLRIQNHSGRELRPVIKVQLIHGIETAIVGSYEVYDAIAPVPVIYDTTSSFVMRDIPIPIPTDFYVGSGTSEIADTLFNLPEGLMALDVAIHDSRYNEEIGHMIMYVRNTNGVQKVQLHSYLLTRVDSNGTEYALDSSYVSSTDAQLGLSHIVLNNLSTESLDNLSIQAYGVANQQAVSGEYLPTDAVKLPMKTRVSDTPDVSFMDENPAVLLETVLPDTSGEGVLLTSSKDVRIDLTNFLRDLFVGSADTPSPLTIYLVVKDNVSETVAAPDSHPNLSVSAIQLYVVDNADVIDGSPCTCYVDTYTGPASSVVFSGCSPELATNACFSGLSYNQVYYYTIFTYNDAGHFSYADRCNQVVYGMFNSIPPGPVCQLQIYPLSKEVEGCVPATRPDKIRLQWINPSDAHLYGFRIYVSEYGHPGSTCSGSHASNFVETNVIHTVADVGSDPCVDSTTDPETACNMMLVYDTFLTPWITEKSPDLSRVPGDTAYFYDGADNVDPAGGFRVLYELAGDGRSLISNAGVRRDLKSGVTYYYTIFTYDVYGNYNAPSCIDRGTLSLQI